MSNINYNDIMVSYGITNDTTLEDLLDIYDKNLKVITSTEQGAIQSVSVYSLPNQVRNMADNVKKRMYGIVTDENVGSIALMSKRFAILYRILDKLNTSVGAVDTKATTNATNIKIASDSLTDFLTNTLPTLQEKALSKDYTLGEKTSKDIETLIDAIISNVASVVNGTIEVNKSKYATTYKDGETDKSIKDNINAKTTDTIEEQTLGSNKYTSITSLVKAITSELNSFLYLATDNSKIDTLTELATKLGEVESAINNVLVNGGLPVATSSTLGAVKVGSGINVDANGVISASASSVGADAKGSANTAEANAKAYTYSKSEIDTKTSDAENNSKAYTDSVKLDDNVKSFVNEEFNKSANLFNNDGNISLNNLGLIVGKQYTLSVNENQFLIKIAEKDGSATSLVERGNTNQVSFTWNGGVNNVYLFNNDYSLKDITNYQVMLNEGNIALPYQEYNGNIIRKKDLDTEISKINTKTFEAIVSSNEKVEVVNLAIPSETNALITKVVGDTKRASENLFDINNSAIQGQSGCEVSISNNNFVVNITDNADPYFFASLESLKLNVGETYTFNYTGSVELNLWLTNAQIVKKGESFVFNGFNNPHFEIENSASGTTYTFSNIMLNKGSQALPYEPYNANLLNSNGSVVSVGENLFDVSKTFNFSGTLQNGTMSGNDTRDSLLMVVQAYNGDNYIGTLTSNSFLQNEIGIINLPFEKNDTYNIIRFGHSGSSSDIKLSYDVSNLPNGTYTLSVNVITNNSTKAFNNIMLVEGTEIKPYKPYQDDSINLIEMGKWDSWENGILTKQTSDLKSISDFSWNTDGDGIFYSTPSDMLFGGEVVSNNYSSDANGIYIDRQYLNIKDTRYNNVSDFLNNCGTFKVAYKLSTPIIEQKPMPNGIKVWKNGLQYQTSVIPYTLSKRYAVSIAEQLQNNVDMDSQQQKQIDELALKVKEMGFKEGVVSVYNGSTTVNSLKKMGKYVLCNLDFTRNYDMSSLNTCYITIPNEFRPKINTKITAFAKINYYQNGSYYNGVLAIYIIVGSDGLIYDNSNNEIGLPLRELAGTIGLELLNVGWEVE